ncbi:hypothetical protein N7461_007737 [Penicillium sp. DV-2018c]|nr:hypothetical protein N7461_007737 [Penicillium sp. DV-2018c]
MVCLLDGFLASEVTSQTQVIVEAKANRRHKHSPRVSMQEAAELVPALVTGPPKGLTKDRALLISQDGDELYVAKAYCLDKYIAIMQDQERNAIAKNDFLKIRQWGPWRINDRDEIEDFARLVLAVALQASAENYRSVYGKYRKP